MQPSSKQTKRQTIGKCKTCGNKIDMFSPEYRSYRYKHGPVPTYCSVACKVYNGLKNNGKASNFNDHG